MKINPRHYILIVFALVSIVATSLTYFYVYKATLSQADSYASSKREFDSEDNRKQKDKELEKVFESTKDSREKLLSFFIKEDRIVNFIESIEKVGTDSNTKLELSSINNDNGVVKVKINAKGSWVSVMSALIMIENLPVNLIVKNVNLNSVGDLDKVKHSWELDLSVEAASIK